MELQSSSWNGGKPTDGSESYDANPWRFDSNNRFVTERDGCNGRWQVRADASAPGGVLLRMDWEVSASIGRENCAHPLFVSHTHLHPHAQAHAYVHTHINLPPRVVRLSRAATTPSSLVKPQVSRPNGLGAGHHTTS